MADFASEYGIRLHSREPLSWAEFRDYLTGLLHSNSRLMRYLTRNDDSEEPDDGE